MTLPVNLSGVIFFLLFAAFLFLIEDGLIAFVGATVISATALFLVLWLRANVERDEGAGS